MKMTKAKLRTMTIAELEAEKLVVDEANARFDRQFGETGTKRPFPECFEPASKKKDRVSIWEHHRKLEQQRTIL